MLTSTSSDQTQVTITIAEAAGHAIASKTVAAMPRPLIGNAATIMPRQVIVAAGAAYYSDPAGEVHRFDVSGADAVVATFTLSRKQQELSFAVSPDGKQVMGSVMSTPPIHDPPPQSLADPLYQDGKPWVVETFLAPAGGAATSVARREINQQPAVSVTRLVGWDATGPVAVLDACIGAQNPPPTLVYCGSALVHLGLDGSHLDRLGGPACTPLDRSAAGVLCYQGPYPKKYEVRSPSGDLVWQQDLGDAFVYNPALSPDGQRIAANDRIFTNASQPASLPREAVSNAGNIQAQAWISKDTLAASGPNSQLVLVHVGDLQHPRSTGLSGVVVGTL